MHGLTQYGRRRVGLGAGLALLGLLAACDGDNVFEPGAGGGPDTGGPNVEIEQPSLNAGTPLGDSLFVQARVQDDRGLDSVVISAFALRGDPNLGTDQVVERFEAKKVVLGTLVRDTVVTRFLQPTPDSTRENSLVVVTAYDLEGNASADTTALVIGGTRVELLNVTDGQTVQAGLSLAIRIRASDPDGVLQVQLDASGAFEESIIRSFSPPQDSVLVDTVLVIPQGVSGAVELVASARNTLDVLGTDGPYTINVGTAGQGDVTPPELRFEASAATRLELENELTLEIVGQDNNPGSGIARAGYTVRGISPTRGDTLVRSGERTFSPPRTGTVVAEFGFKPFNVDSLSLPDTLVYEIHTWMVDANGNCAAAVAGEEPVSLTCETLPGGEVVAADRSGLRLVRSVVAGRTVQLPQGGEILDAVVDTVRRNLLLSNHTRDRLEVFRLQEEEFLEPVPIGSEPWGLSLNRAGDTLLVANSGGTNISNVYLGPALNLDPAFIPFEDNARRLLTPDVVLFDVERSLDDTGRLRYTVTHHPRPGSTGFSDRPQFMAVDSTGRVLYSTRVVEALDEVGTIRRAFVPEGGTRPEVRLFYEHARMIEAPEFVGIANVDDAAVTPGSGRDLFTVFDHLPGRTTEISAGPDTLEAVTSQISDMGSDIEVFAGRWNVPGIGFSDTTFVAASGDRGWVVFGEGSISPVGRVIMYDAAKDRLSGVVPVTDIMTNAGETVRGVSLNHDGTLGVARGSQAYFFSTDLRLQGMADLPAGGAGAALHPLHANYPSLDNQDGSYDPDTHLAFVGTGQNTIDIIDAFHFNRLGRIFIRDVITGPLQAVLPFPEDNADFQCQMKDVRNGSGDVIGQSVDIFADANGTLPYGPDGGPTDDRCVVVKLFGTSSSGGVVVIDVRKGDVLREHPSRL